MGLVKRGLMISVVIFTFSRVCVAQYKLSGLDLEGDMLSWYDQQIGLNNTEVISGTFKPIIRSSRGTHSFFKESSWQDATIHYKGQTYTGLKALYEIQEETLVIQHPVDFSLHMYPIELFASQVDWFEIGGHFFRNYRDGILLLPGGFFNELVVGEKVSIIVKRKKKMVSSSTSTMVQFEEDDSYFIRIGAEYHRLTMFKNSFLKHFQEHKRELRKFITERNLTVKAGNDYDLKMTAEFCETLMSNEK